MITIKTPEEIVIMAEAGKILAQVLQKVLARAVPGTTTVELDKYCEELILAAEAKPSFKMVPDYHHATCMCVNEIVVHGIPTDYRLVRGDILGIDLGVYYRGFHSDGSWSVEIGNGKNKFLETGERALELAIQQCVTGKHVGDISQAMQRVIEDGGYAPVKQLVGHGIGRELHEDPEIPCYLRGRAQNTPEIKAGMIFAVEAIYNQGGSPIVYAGDDGWTIVTRDGKPWGLFEHTVAITPGGPRILTKL
jgi:methionyl aminopeptidase